MCGMILQLLRHDPDRTPIHASFFLPVVNRRRGHLSRRIGNPRECMIIVADSTTQCCSVPFPISTGSWPKRIGPRTEVRGPVISNLSFCYLDTSGRVLSEPSLYPLAIISIETGL